MMGGVTENDEGGKEVVGNGRGGGVVAGGYHFYD